MSDPLTVLEVPCSQNKGSIHTAMPVAQIANRVLDRQVVILKEAFSSDKLLNFRAEISAWAASTPAELHGTPLQDISAGSNIHRIDSDPTKSTAPHIYHTFNFNNFSALPPQLEAFCVEIFGPMRILQNDLTGNNAEFRRNQGPFRLRPQVMQYPTGGGFIAKHYHSFLPQKIGLILNLSRRGTDYISGGTRFDLPTGPVDIEDRHEIGDIALFRYDLNHEVTPVEPESAAQWELARGRWVAVLAYY